MAFFTQKVWVEWIEQGLANGEYNYQDFKDLSDVEQIGSSKLYKALMKKDDVETMVCMKYIGNKLSTREVQTELKLLRRIQFFNNENITKFYGITKSEINDKNQLKYMVVLEYGDGGSLRDYLQNNLENLHWNIRLKFARQLANAVAFLHENNLIHKNLHSNNLIINQQNLKIKSLGITCKMSESSNVLTNLQNFLPYVDPQYFNVPNYKSIEDKQSALTKKSDIYSLGVLLWEISSGKLPFSSEEHPNLQKEIMEGLRENDVNGIDQAYIEIYKTCWRNEPNDRPDIQEVVSALGELDEFIDPPVVQEDKKVKIKRFSTNKVPSSPVPPPKTPINNKPKINSTPPPTPPPSQPPQPKTKPQPPPIKKPTLTVPNVRSRSKSPEKSRSKSPMKRALKPKSPSPIPKDTIIEEKEEEIIRMNSPAESENSTTGITAQSQSSISSLKSPLISVLKSESPRSLSPIKKSHSLKEKSPVRRSRPKSKSIIITPSEKSPTRAKSPNFTTRPPRTSRRSASVSVPKKQSITLQRSKTIASQKPKSPSPSRSPSRCLSPKKFAHKSNNRRYSTSYINSSMQINAQSSLAGLWTNNSDRSREDPTKKIIDELLSLFMATYEVNPDHSLLKVVQEFLENQEEETFEIFDWLLTTQLSLQYKILLGYFYLNGVGTLVDNRKAFVLFLSAAKKQYAIAQDLLGFCYLNGKGTVKDEILAFEWYQKAAANGSVTAFQSLGECYHNGNGTVKNKSKALQYFKLASDGGNVCGKNMMGYCYEMGLGISSDPKKAFYLYKQAADAGYELAKKNVAKCYKNGIGVTADSEAAAYWLEKAN